MSRRAVKKSMNHLLKMSEDKEASSTSRMLHRNILRVLLKKKNRDGDDLLNKRFTFIFSPDVCI
jgi:hypothetical protein